MVTADDERKKRWERWEEEGDFIAVGIEKVGTADLGDSTCAFGVDFEGLRCVAARLQVVGGQQPSPGDRLEVRTTHERPVRERWKDQSPRRSVRELVRGLEAARSCCWTVVCLDPLSGHRMHLCPNQDAHDPCDNY
jgi:hypothetical protein